MLRAQREEWPDAGQCDEIELVSADLADAYCHMAVSEKELGNCAAPSTAPGKYLVFTAMLFGFKGAPPHHGAFRSHVGQAVTVADPYG